MSVSTGSTAKTLILGAGPAGLAVAACLSRRGVPFQILERASVVGSAWHDHYERLHLHTTADESHLPHAPMPGHYPRYVPRHLVVEYLESYADRFGITPSFGRTVERVRATGAGWRVTTAEGSEWSAPSVVFALGFNRRPVEPSWPGMERFQGSIVHSHTYRSGAAYSGRHVLVVGMGNTGAEIALDLHEQGARASLSVRGPVNIIPRDILGRPTAKTALLLSRLPRGLGNPIGSLLRRLTTGDLSRYGIRTPQLPPLAQLRTLGKTPVVDVGTVRLIKRGEIRVHPGIVEFSEEGARFSDGSVEGFDDVVLATGFSSDVGDFLEDTLGLLDAQGHPAGLWGEGIHDGLYFIGYDGYSPGGVLRSIRRDAPLIADRVAARSARARGAANDSPAADLPLV